jgi:hypothetical protein
VCLKGVGGEKLIKVRTGEYQHLSAGIAKVGNEAAWSGSSWAAR